MNKNIEFAKSLLDKIIGLKAKNVQLGHGSFITFDFGKMIKISVKTSRGIEYFDRGEWHFWIYMCSWRIDKNGKPLIASNDPRERIAVAVKKLENKKLIKYEMLDQALDAKLYFEGNLSLSLFNCNTDDGEHWKLFTPDRNVLLVGPSDQIIYKSASSRK